MAPLDKRKVEEMDKREVEEMIARAISQVKEETDKALNTEMRKLSDKIKQLEEERRQKEEQLKVLADERDTWKIAHAEIQQEFTRELHRMQEDIHHWRGAVREEGELSHMDELKEGLKKECIAELKEDMIQEMDTKQGSWIEVVKKNIKKEVREERAKEEVTRVQDTLEEEKLRHARRLNVRIIGLPEGASPDTDAQAFCRSLGYTTMPFTRVLPSEGLRVQVVNRPAVGIISANDATVLLEVDWKCEKIREQPYEVDIRIPFEDYDPVNFFLHKECRVLDAEKGIEASGMKVLGVLSLIVIVGVSIMGITYNCKFEKQCNSDDAHSLPLISDNHDQVVGREDAFQGAIEVPLMYPK
ncbi:hypothetical protein L7F22_044727 [Adiantum nelumboides]|nr:hypothetical protein [Adiantum nelumboides]